MPDILIVEDDKAIGKALSIYFSSKGYYIDLALDGKTALNLGKNKPYDVLLADLCLPDMNGLTVIKEIKYFLPDIIPIVITGHSSVENTIEAIRLGVNDYFEKPINLELLKTSIHKKLSKRLRLKKDNEQKLTQMLREYKQYNKESVPAKADLLETPQGNVSESLAMLVHQINNPLSIIQGNAQLAMMNLKESKNVSGLLKSIIKATSEISQINERIISIDKPVRYEQESIDVKAVLLKCLLMFKPLLRFKHIELITHWSKQDCHILADNFGIEQVFNNLILNAIESMEASLPKTATLTIIVETIPNYIKIRIKDTGEGISPQHLDKIYQSYFTTKEKGTGLGLSVIKNILDKHRGEIHINSQVAKGTEFTILLQKNTPGPYWN